MPELEKELKIGKPVYTEVLGNQEQDLKKKKEYLNWMEKEGKQQIKKTKEIEE
jgi:cytolysin (calcineurin-like family phosphatase)